MCYNRPFILTASSQNLLMQECISVKKIYLGQKFIGFARLCGFENLEHINMMKISWHIMEVLNW